MELGLWRLHIQPLQLMAGVPITSYEYSTNGGSTWTTAPSNPFTVSGYGNNASVSVLVRAKNPVGAGDSTSGSGTTANVPSAPTMGAITDGCTTHTFPWTAGANNGLAITKYAWQYSTDGGTSWSSATETTSAAAYISSSSGNNWGDFHTQSSYKVRAAAYNAAGWGSYSSASSATVAWGVQRNPNRQIYTSTSRACSQVACGTCGCQSRDQDAFKYGDLATYQWTKSGCTTSNASSGSWENVDANFGDYGSCYNIGGCGETTSANNYQDLPEVAPDYYNGGPLVYVGWFTGGPENQAYRQFSPLFGWYVADSSGNATYTCNSGSCLLASTGIKHCNICGNNKYIPYGAECNCFSCC
jgi:hypothetical protein